VSRKSAAPPERVKGTYAAMPHAVLDSVAYQGAAPMAKALLPELLRQLNGSNNGHLHLAMSWLSRRGWKSCDVVQRAKNNLIERGLIVQTSQGGKNMGPSMHAVTWLPISVWRGLALPRDTYHPGKWAAMNKCPAPSHGAACTATRSSAIPPHGAEDPAAAPPDGAKTPDFGTNTAPPHGRNVPMPLPSGSAPALQALGTRRLLLVKEATA
jgi:hypothetical protein